jgi:hypothetical protein
MTPCSPRPWVSPPRWVIRRAAAILWRGGDARSLWRAAVLGVVSRSSAAGAGRAGSVRTASRSGLASTVRACRVSPQAGPGDRTDC